MTEELSRKADLALSDLATNGGLLTVEQASSFIRNVIDQPTILRQLRTVTMNGPSMEMPKIGIGSRMLKAARQIHSEVSGDGRALLYSERTRPTTDKIELNTSEVIAEIRLPYETLEDNIERGGMENTILALIAERASLDLEELIIQGDTALAGTDAYLGLQEGVLKKLSSNVVDATGLGVSPDMFNNTVKALPTRFRRNKAQMRFFLPPDVEQDYRNDQAKRGTNLGDVTLTGDAPLRLFGSSAQGVAMMPEANSVFTNPKNILFGIQRNVRVETDRDISAREIIIVLTARVAIEIEEELAAVKVTNIGAVA